MTTPGENEVDNIRKGCISVVPEVLINENTRVFYHPQVISLGPYHFRKESLNRVGELKHLQSSIMDGKNSLLEEFENDAIYEKIKESYSENSSSGKDFNFTKTETASMMVRDASFVIEVLERFSDTRNGSDNGGTRASPSIVDRILDRKRCHPLLNHIVKDMFKMENQLPFWVLQRIKHDKANEEIKEVGIYNADESWYESALENLSPIALARNTRFGEVKRRRFGKEYEIFNREYKKDHILQLLHDYIVDRRNGILVHFNTYLSIILSMLLLLLLFPFFIIWLLWHCILLPCRGDYQLLERSHSVSTVEELKRDGVKFKKLEGKGISHIKFEKNNLSLHLPRFRVDDKSEVILRNLIALEICSEEEEKPVMAYVNLMNHLINTSTDVAILGRQHILDNKLGSDKHVAELWNSFIFTTEKPTYKPIDDTFDDIIGYRKNKLKVLWGQFRVARCSKPWLVVPALGASLLFLFQVVCLFQSCQRQNRP